MVDITSILSGNESSPVGNYFSSKIEGLKKENDLNVVGIGGFSMYAEISNKRTLSSRVPDIVMEDNTIINDTIQLDPIKISISGLVSDVFIRNNSSDNIIRDAINATGIVSLYLPTRTQAQINKIFQIANDASNAISKIDSIIDDGTQIYNLFGDKSNSKTLQEQFLDMIDSIHFTKGLISIDSPFRKYENMRITSAVTEIDTETNEKKFTLEIKQVRLRGLLYVESEAKAPSSALNGQTDSVIDKGLTEGSETEQSLLSFFLGDS